MLEHIVILTEPKQIPFQATSCMIIRHLQESILLVGDQLGHYDIERIAKNKYPEYTIQGAGQCFQKDNQIVIFGASFAFPTITKDMLHQFPNESVPQLKLFEEVYPN